MRNLLVVVILALTFSNGWGVEKKINTKSRPMSTASDTFTGKSLSTKDSVVKVKPNNESNLKMQLRTDNYDSQFAKGNLFQLRLNYNLKYFVIPSLYMKLNPILRLNAGHVQSVDGADRLSNRVSIQNAGLYYEWMKESYLSAGILDQFDVFSPVFIDDQVAFVSVQGKQSYVTGPWTFSLFAQTAMPNTESATTDHNEKDATPLVNAVGLASRWTTSETNDALIKANYFKFSQVPTTVSTTSVIRGNTPSDSVISDTQRTFKYEYYGIDSDMSFKRRLFKNYYMIGAGSYLQNQGAPNGVNQAFRYGGGLGTIWNTNHQIELSGYQFRIESDSTLGAYSNVDYFHTNHQGFEVWGSWKHIKNNFRVSFNYVDMRLITENPGQSDAKLYVIRFEALNVDI